MKNGQRVGNGFLRSGCSMKNGQRVPQVRMLYEEWATGSSGQDAL